VPEPALKASRADGVLTVTLDRPERRNALSLGMWRALRDTLRVAGDDPSLRVLVLTGAGGAFCSGADLGPNESSGDGSGDGMGHPLARMRLVEETVLGLHRLPVPTVARVDGVAVGAGWNLALACDLVVATPRSRFSQIFARRGLSLDAGGSWLLPRLVGLQQAKRLAFLAETIDAEEAHRLGLVTWLREPDELDGFVAGLTARLVAGPPVALAQSKALLDEGPGRTLAEALGAEGRAQAVNFATDAPAAFRAFRARVDPVFTGEWHGDLDG